MRPRPGRRQLRPGHRRRPHRPPLVHGPVRTGRHRLHQGHRPQRPDQPPAHHDQAGDVPGVDDPAVVQRHRTQPGPHLLPGVRGRRRPSLRRAGDGGGPRRTHPDLGAVRRPRRVDRRRIHRGRTRSLAVPDTVANACSFLGLDPLYVANEGKLVAFVPPDHADTVLEAMRAHPLGKESVRIGTCVEDHPGMVVAATGLGGTRVVDMPLGEQLPRIC
ncbi:AIR synthase-related protein [Streptomyces cyaneofuscatus]|uniref:AIR synthase-related protein n=1 Tax=Streptomyces cyaneofuscatus TaxID=66883 RepID=UPI003CC7F7A4